MIIVLMGVSGSGKTTIGILLAEALGWDFVDGDDFHPEANVEKMSRGEPLTDADRRPWLRSIREFIDERLATDNPAIVACSALKPSYRSVLLKGAEDVHLVYLRGDYDLIRERMEARADHFFDADMLDSQFATLEEPSADEAFIVDIDASPDEIVQTICRALPVGPSPCR